jgi:phosphatidylserine decarboxylase
MSLLDSVKKIFVPIHKEGYPFIAIAAVATVVLGNLWSPFGWVGLIITLWICYFFRDPARRWLRQHDRAGCAAARA